MFAKILATAAVGVLLIWFSSWFFSPNVNLLPIAHRTIVYASYILCVGTGYLLLLWKIWGE